MWAFFWIFKGYTYSTEWNLVSLFIDLFWPQEGVLCWKWCTKNLENLKNGKVAGSLWKLKYINWNGFAEGRKHFSTLKKSSPLTFPAIVLSTGQLGETTVCHSNAGHLHHGRATDTWRQRKSIIPGAFTAFVWLTVLPQMFNSHRRSHILSLWSDVWAAQIKETVDLSVGTQEKILLVCPTKSLCDATRKPLVWLRRDWCLMKRMHTKLSWGRQKTQLSFICASYTSPSDLEIEDCNTDQLNESYMGGEIIHLWYCYAAFPLCFTMCRLSSPGWTILGHIWLMWRFCLFFKHCCLNCTPQ